MSKLKGYPNMLGTQTGNKGNHVHTMLCQI